MWIKIDICTLTFCETSDFAVHNRRKDLAVTFFETRFARPFQTCDCLPQVSIPSEHFFGDLGGVEQLHTGHER